MQLIKKILAGFIWLMVVYLVVGYFLHLVVFPEYKPYVEGYYEPGDVLYSKAEGVRQTIMLQVDQTVIVAQELEPHAKGPALHVHYAFDEMFEANEKPVSMQIGRDVFVLNPGEKLLVRRGVPHRMFNDSDSAVILFSSEMGIPARYAIYLNQLYCFMDEAPANADLSRAYMQMSLFSQYLDTYIADGPPIKVQRLLYFLLRPAARLWGYKSYYEEYSFRRYEAPMLYTGN
jgi:mannose-6-phosphate isomerase-like protein (cupin superfamily)